MEEIRTEEIKTNIFGYLKKGWFCRNCLHWSDASHSCKAKRTESTDIDVEELTCNLQEHWFGRTEIDKEISDGLHDQKFIDNWKSYQKHCESIFNAKKGIVPSFSPIEFGPIGSRIPCDWSEFGFGRSRIPDLIIGPTPNIDIGPIDSSSSLHSFEFGPVPSFSPIEFIGPAPSFSPIEFGYKIPSTIWN